MLLVLFPERLFPSNQIRRREFGENNSSPRAPRAARRRRSPTTRRVEKDSNSAGRADSVLCAVRKGRVEVVSDQPVEVLSGLREVS